jgi:hypothetical protein
MRSKRRGRGSPCPFACLQGRRKKRRRGRSDEYHDEEEEGQE